MARVFSDSADGPEFAAAMNEWEPPAPLPEEMEALRRRVKELEAAVKSEFQRGYTMGKDS
jgi:hypothetical protein